MAVTAYWYSKSFVNLVTRAKNIDFDTNTIKVMMTTNTYTPDQDVHEDKADVTNEVTGTAYVAGGATLGSKTCTNTLNVVKLDGADTTWASSTIANARRAVVYDDSGATDADKALLLWVDFGADQSSVAGDFTIQWNAAGIATITAADAVGFP